MTTRRSAGENDSRSSGARREVLEGTIIEQAARLFAERGYAGTNPQDIADAVGVSRQNLYYYFKSKDDILARLVAEMTSQGVADIEEISSGPGTAPDRLRRLARHLVLDRATNGMRFRMLDRSESALPPEVSERFLQARRAALAATVNVIEDGMAEGWFRGVDPRIAALSVIGMCNWVAWWFEPGHGVDVNQTADQIAEAAVASIARVGKAATSPRAVIDTISDDLNRLRDLLDGQE